jgi:glycosyltransferase involved in cell wall biosynthesis
MRVSVIILTFNEEANLPACLSALGDIDDVHVLDSGSTDGTVRIAETFGAKVLQRPFDNFADQRNFGLRHCDFRHDWILHLDADEILTEELRQEISCLPEVGGVYAYRVPSKTIFFGKWIRRAGMYPVYQVRLGRRDRLRFRQVGHGQRETLSQEQIGTLNHAYLHYSFSTGLSAWFHKHVRYAADEAEHCLLVRSGNGAGTVRSVPFRIWLKDLSYRVPLLFRPFLRMFYVTFIRGGLLEGWRGILYGLMLAIYEAMIAVLVYEKDLTRRGLTNRPKPHVRRDPS